MQQIAGFILLFSIFSLLGCTALKFQEELSDYTNDVSQLENLLLKEPQNARLLRDLGIIYFKNSSL